ncbi:MAG: site-specific DNA-methyltransferase, partial [Candidatus Aenigmarchaeota archaeon]|nr:site-specific DNA-methyltransferase [Candidatus Aenigmarchaeota archaeon]
EDIEKLETRPCNTVVENCDARKMRLESESIDAIITSPPYLNNIDYTKVYAIENWFVGQPEPSIRSYIGLDDPEKLAENYSRDMEFVLEEMFRVCKPGANVGIVLANAYFPREEKIVDVDIELARIAEKTGFKAKEILVLNKRYALERRTIQKGVLRESLIVLEKG